MKEKPTVGMKLYSLNIGNAARRAKQELTPVVVTKVGRKYFSCALERDSYFETQYHLDTWKEKTDYSANSILYSAPSEWEDEKEINRIADKIRKVFQYLRTPSTLTIEHLRSIDKILTDAGVCDE